VKWYIDFSKSSLKFISKNNVSEGDIISIVIKGIKKLKGKAINIDIKKMKGSWKGFYRVRMGKMRLLINIDFENLRIYYIDKIDYRGLYINRP